MDERLVKYCCTRYNVALGAQTLQLGSLDYYRQLDPHFAIADPGEATHTVSFREGVAIDISGDVGKRLFGGQIGADGGSLTMTAHLPNAHFKITANNVYVFCVSRTTPDDPPSLSRGVEFDCSYDSMWEITDRLAFRDAIGAALLDFLTLANLTDHSTELLARLPLKELSLGVRMLDKGVEYIESRTHHVEIASDADKVPDCKVALERSLFTKEKRDERQREYRFVYAVTHPRLGQLSVKPDPIQIPLNRLSGMIGALRCGAA